MRLPCFLVLPSVGLAALAAQTDEPPLRTPADLSVDLVARDPAIAQPVFLNFDERGRMWIVEYRQYPEPAGLTLLSRDSIWRVRYDRHKPAPPYDTPEKAPFRGRDRITILEDVNGDGSFTKAKTFVDGLNITSAVVRGAGGVWVLSPPQLLWYPDRNDDDVPDGPPTVELDGFGIEDTHSIANSLRWGPDGWLYGAAGSTVSADIVRPGLDKEPIAKMIGQGIWRYHPPTRRFEVFAEGGGNAFSVEIDAKGRVFSGHNGGNTRGFHYVQGGYLRKGFDKHGELSNPYAFGFFPAMRHAEVKRFTHNFVIYEAAALPPPYRGKLIGIDPMNHYLPVADLTARGATFETKDIEAAIRTEDRKFRPVDIKVGPDGAIYIADWRDFQVNHYRNHEGQITREDGRIYRVRAREAKPGGAAFDLRKKTSRELVDVLRSAENRWWRETALQVLGERRDATIVPMLRAELEKNEPGQFALEALWALNVSGGFNEAIARQLLGHADPFVRGWTVRLIGDAAQAEPATARALIALAAREPHIEVRSQLAASAKRFPAEIGLPIAQVLLTRTEDIDDPYLPLQIWWAIESKCHEPSAVLALFGGETARESWTQPMMRTHIAPRLMRRFAAAGGAQNLTTCAQLLALAPDVASRKALVSGFEQAFEGRPLPALPSELIDALVKAGGGSLALRIRQRDPAALAEGVRVMSDPRIPVVERVRVITTFGEVPHTPAAEKLGALLGEGKREIVRAALGAAAAYDSAELTSAMLSRYASFGAEERTVAQSVLASRLSSARALVAAVETGTIAKATLSAETQEKLRLVADAELKPRLDKLFGVQHAPEAGSVDAEIERIAAVVRGGKGSPYAGRTLYEQRCLACHRLFKTGGEIGPDLTAFKRDDLASLLLAIVNPAAEIREGYESFVLTKKDGAVHSGFVSAQDERQVVIRDMAGLSVTVPREQIASLQGLGTSLMPPGLLAGLSDRELSDFFSYLRLSQPLVGKED
jgi:putative membrane-bound dehydrogenase-like protein